MNDFSKVVGYQSNTNINLKTEQYKKNSVKKNDKIFGWKKRHTDLK